MKKHAGILFAAGALVAFFAAMQFSRQRTVAAPPGGVQAPAATSTDRSETSVSPETPAVAGTSTSSAASDDDAGAAGLQLKAAAAMDLSTGGLLYGIRPDRRWPLASITKLMTAMVVTGRMDPDGTIVMAPADFASGGSALTANLEPGDQYRVRDLLKVLLVPSSNEAAAAFARAYGHDAFIAAMNAQAAAWGLAATHFDDASGLSVSNQSTPRELLEMARRIYLAHPEIFAITQSPAATVQELGSGGLKQFPTTNGFAGRPDFIGGKTGTTPEAGDNLVSIFSVGGTPVAVAVFGAADRYAATRSLLQLVQ